MGDTPLHQEVHVDWVLAGQFIEVYVRQADASDGRLPYQAIYLIGRDAQGQYVFSLFDTFGVATTPVAGVGELQGDAIEFIFHYSDGEFRNTISWDALRDGWDMRLEQANAAGHLELFAEKHLARCSPPVM